MNDLYRLLLGVLCVWRITHLFQAEDGPWDVIVRIRQAAGDGIAGQLLDCFYCLSLWISIPLAWAIGHSIQEKILMGLAFSGGAILLERSTSKAIPDAPIIQALFEEDKEK
ncbi:DUF1360 domain-containing protein [Acidicapsa acidisoli]|uniref:DUF1360 domain-containing protein n=1 Tax=Acidicapsa acidisoli TaxID=1615681 RepID=UPI0021E09C5E|nr:DUF1360 domain-containing protein [Acidicapsa acidisoli]